MPLNREEWRYVNILLKDIEENKEWYAAMSYVE